jgi:hypothetical protein
MKLLHAELLIFLNSWIIFIMDRYVAVVLGECFFTRDDHFMKLAIAESSKGQENRNPKSFSHFSSVFSTQTNLSHVESA